MRATADSVRGQVGQVSDEARDRWTAPTEIRKASRSRAPDSWVPGECWDRAYGPADGECPGRFAFKDHGATLESVPGSWSGEPGVAWGSCLILRSMLCRCDLPC